MKLELHMIQNFPPSCLNRDDTNSPKDCEFGGVRRARISSQCIKRAIRKCFGDEKLLPVGNLAVRTKRLVDEVLGKLTAAGKPEAVARAAIEAAIGGMGLGVGEDGQTQYLLFLSRSGIDALAAVCLKHWDKLADLVKPSAAAEDAKSKKAAKDAKKLAKDTVPDEIKSALKAVLDGQTAADLALFGRMLADLPGQNIDAACQVAHAISTNKIAMELDFFTAVDDLKEDSDEAGAGMMGVVGYNSACFYRYAMLDFDQLAGNLGGDKELARRTVEAFLKAAALAVPTGKQNTFAAHSRPDLILAVLRDKGAPLSLANAFVSPARPSGDKDLTQISVEKLADYWQRLGSVYGNGECGAYFCATTRPEVAPKGWQDVVSLDTLTAKVVAALTGGKA